MTNNISTTPIYSAVMSNDQDQYLNELLTESQAVAEYKLTPRCFQNWRMNGQGPKFVKVSNRAIRYMRRHLIEFAQNRLRKSTSDMGAA